MPPIGLLMGKVDFTNLFAVLQPGEAAGPYATLAEAQEAGAVTLNWGLFILSIVSFLIIGFSVFLMIRQLTKLQKQEEEAPAEPTKGVPALFLGGTHQGHAVPILHLADRDRGIVVQ